MPKDVRVFIVDCNFRKIVSRIGMDYPLSGPVPNEGFVVEEQDGPLVFAGIDEDDGSVVTGICSDGREKWVVRKLEISGEEDLYLCGFEDYRDLFGRSLEVDPFSGILGTPFRDYFAWVIEDHNVLFDLTFEHDVHDHSYSRALARIEVTCEVDLRTGEFSAEDCLELPPPSLSSHELREKVQPGDYTPVGDHGMRKLLSIINQQGNRAPLVLLARGEPADPSETG